MDRLSSCCIFSVNVCICTDFFSLFLSCSVVLFTVLPSSSSQNPAESSAPNASVPDELWAQRDQPALEDIK